MDMRECSGKTVIVHRSVTYTRHQVPDHEKSRALTRVLCIYMTAAIRSLIFGSVLAS